MSTTAASPRPSRNVTITAPWLNPNRGAQAYQQREYPKFVWFFVASCIAALILSNAIYILRVRARKRALAKTISSPTVVGEPSHGTTSQRSALRNVPRAIETAFTIVAHRWTLPYGLHHVISVSELAVSAGYLGALLTWSFVKTHDLQPGWWNQRVATIAWYQLPLLPLLSGKNNLIGFVTGISYEKINVIHRAAARSIFILVLCHAFNKVPFSPTSLKNEKYRSGVMAATAFGAIFLFSLRPIRAHAFELFLILHVSLICVLLAGCYYHQTKDAIVLWVFIGIWAFDRFIRGFKLLKINQGKPQCTDAIIETISPNAVRLTLPNRDIRWKAGQHVFLTLPGVSTIPFESHPFTIASIPNGQKTSDLVFYIRSMDGFTRKLDNYALTHDGQSVTALVDGPYGCPPPVNTFSTVVLVSGGSGISFTMPLLLDAIAAVKRKESPIKRIVFLWSLKSAAEVKWASQTLAEVHNTAPSGLSLDIRVHVTRANSLLTSSDVSEKGDDKSDEKGTIESPSTDAKHSIEHIETAGKSGTVITTGPADEGMSHDGHMINTMETYKTILGRATIKAMIHEEIEASFGPVLVAAAGPIPLTKAVRASLRSGPASPLAVLRGSQPVTMYIENFGAVRAE